MATKLMHPEKRIVFLMFFVSFGNPSTSLMKPSIPPAYQLVNDLLDGYVPCVPPSRYSNESVVVTVGYEIAALGRMSEKEATISIVGWFYLGWIDGLLVWDPTRYNNVESILLPSDKIWLPDVKFINGVDKLFYDLSSFYAIVDYNGSVIFAPGGPLSLTCVFNLTYYPFDEQSCSIEMGSWSTTEDKMQLILENPSSSRRKIDNGEWELIDIIQLGFSVPFPGGNYSMLKFKLLLKRKPQYQVVNVVLPVITLPLLNLVVFRLPPECGEKVSLSITILLAFSVWLLMMSSITPSSSDNMPIVAVCTVIFMSLSTISVLLTVVVVHLYHKDESRNIPSWVRWLLLRYQRQCAGNKQVQPIDATDCRVKMTWRDVAAAVDSIAFYSFLVIIITVVVVAAGAIIAGAPRQSSLFYASLK